MSIYYFAILEKTASKPDARFQVWFPELQSDVAVSDTFEDAMDMASPLLVKTVQNRIFLNKPLPTPMSAASFAKAYAKKQGSDSFIQAFRCPDIEQMPVKTTFTISQINLYFLERERLSRGISKSELVNKLIEKAREEK